MFSISIRMTQQHYQMLKQVRVMPMPAIWIARPCIRWVFVWTYWIALAINRTNGSVKCVNNVAIFTIVIQCWIKITQRSTSILVDQQLHLTVHTSRTHYVDWNVNEINNITKTSHYRMWMTLMTLRYTHIFSSFW